MGGHQVATSVRQPGVDSRPQDPLSLGDEFGAHTVVEMCWGIAPVIAAGVAADVG